MQAQWVTGTRSRDGHTAPVSGFVPDATVPRADVRQITRSEPQPARFPPGILGYLYAWLKHIDLKANTEVYVEAPVRLTGQLPDARDGADAASGAARAGGAGQRG